MQTVACWLFQSWWYGVYYLLSTLLTEMILCFFGKLCLANLTFAQQQHRPTRQARAGNKCGNMNRGDFWIDKPTQIFFGLKQNPCEEGGRQKQYLWWWWWWLDRISRCQHSVLVAVSPRVSPLASARTTQQTLKLSLSPPSLLSTPDLDIIYGDTS